MSEPFMCEIRIFSFAYAPRGWAFCNGQLLPINQNQALFALLGTMYGGNGQTTFALPDLRGRTPIHFINNSFNVGQTGGEQVHTLTTAELPTHTHLLNATNTAAVGDDASNLLFAQAGGNVYAPFGGATAMGPQSVTSSGGNQPHENRQPYLTLNLCIALQGIFPSQN